MALTKKRRKFIEEYLQSFNATQAAIASGTPEKSGYAVGWEMLRIPEIAEAIEKHLRESAMSADEVLMRLGEQARAEYTKYIDDRGNVDLSALIADGKSHLIKGIKETRYGQQIEFYDSQAALNLLAKHHGLLTDRIRQEVVNIDIPWDQLTEDQLKSLAEGESLLDVLGEIKKPPEGG